MKSSVWPVSQQPSFCLNFRFTKVGNVWFTYHHHDDVICLRAMKGAELLIEFHIFFPHPDLNLMSTKHFPTIVSSCTWVSFIF